MAYPTDYGAYSPPYAMPRVGTGAGEGPGGSTPYIGGAGDPNAAGQSPQAPAAGSNYGPYLGWDQGKLNDPSHTTPKYQFLRAMLDAGISSQNRDLSGAVAALKARGYDVDAIPGSSDQIRWGNAGTYDIFNGTNGDFLFGEQNVGGAPNAVPNAGEPAATGALPPLAPSLRSGLGATYGMDGKPMNDPNAQSATGQTGSSYAAPSPYAGGQYGAYRPPYLNGAV